MTRFSRGIFLSTLSLRRATYDTYAKVLRVNISIHALLAESDVPAWFGCYDYRQFLSTLSLRRATLNSSCISSIKKNFYPRSPCGERPLAHIRRFPFRYFYPRSPCGERRASILQTGLRRRISIHALLAESDSTSERLRIPSHYFYPRSPCGERPVLWG